MILYTPLALEDVLQQQGSDELERESITLGGKMIYVDKLPNGEYQMARLVSTDPNDYLNKSYEPGSSLF